jgi:hypothetical protein
VKINIERAKKDPRDGILAVWKSKNIAIHRLNETLLLSPYALKLSTRERIFASWRRRKETWKVNNTNLKKI